MIQQEKQLLLKDLCARVPYRTFVCLNPGAYNKPETCILTGVDGEQVHLNVDSDPFRIDHIKPYLRSMSSMTEKEKCIYLKLRAHALPFAIVEWLDKNHFDHRTNKNGETLIETGLALEAKEGMYKTE